MPNVSRSKGNQTMKFDKLIECNIRNIFLEKSYSHSGGETSPRSFSNQIKIAPVSGSMIWNFIQFVFIVWQVGGYRNTLKLVSLPHFLHNFRRKIFLLLYYINWPNSIFWLSLLCEIFGNMCIAIICKPVCDVMNFEVKLVFLIKPFFLQDQKVVTKT